MKRIFCVLTVVAALAFQVNAAVDMLFSQNFNMQGHSISNADTIVCTNLIALNFVGSDGQFTVILPPSAITDIAFYAASSTTQDMSGALIDMNTNLLALINASFVGSTNLSAIYSSVNDAITLASAKAHTDAGVRGLSNYVVVIAGIVSSNDQAYAYQQMKNLSNSMIAADARIFRQATNASVLATQPYIAAAKSAAVQESIAFTIPLVAASTDQCLRTAIELINRATNGVLLAAKAYTVSTEEAMAAWFINYVNNATNKTTISCNSYARALTNRVTENLEAYCNENTADGVTESKDYTDEQVGALSNFVYGLPAVTNGSFVNKSGDEMLGSLGISTSAVDATLYKFEQCTATSYVDSVTFTAGAGGRWTGQGGPFHLSRPGTFTGDVVNGFWYNGGVSNWIARKLIYTNGVWYTALEFSQYPDGLVTTNGALLGPFFPSGTGYDIGPIGTYSSHVSDSLTTSGPGYPWGMSIISNEYSLRTYVDGVAGGLSNYTDAVAGGLSNYTDAAAGGLSNYTDSVAGGLSNYTEVIAYRTVTNYVDVTVGGPWYDSLTNKLTQDGF